MYLRPHDLLVMTAVGLAPPRFPEVPRHRHPERGVDIVVHPARRRRSAALRRLLGRMLLRSGIRLLRSARPAGQPLRSGLAGTGR